MDDAQDTIDKLTLELAQKASEARVLQEVSAQMNATLDLDEILSVVLRTMDELFGFHHSLVLLLDEDGEQLTVAASCGYDDAGAGAKVRVGVGVIGVVAKRQKIMRVNNLGQQRAYAAAIRKRMEASGQEVGGVVELPGLTDAECQIAIPLTIKDDLIGVFSVESADQNVFDERDEVLATIVANQAAAAINNAKQYRDQAQRREELAKAHAGLKQLTETLEDRVRARTAELERTNRELHATQAQLVQSGKMASLGQLVAGVAHELNTPIGSILSNADLALRALQKVKKALEANDALESDRRLARSIQALERACETEMLASERVAGIVRSLRNFARLDESEEKRADIHEGIDNTLGMIQHQLKGIELVKQYGELPELLCFPNQLNQVFMNLLVNASQAIDPPGTITVRTELKPSEVIIQIIDTGKGIPPDNIGRVFDPGFTTKGVGVGTGLGLSICYRIIEMHKGHIGVASSPGEATTFTIRLPLR